MEPLILGLESSCDETAGALVRGRETVAEFVASQIDLHRRFGGVVPEVACRAHMEALLPGLADLFVRAGLAPQAVDAIAVTCRPGLIGALLVGVTAAKALALAWDKPLVGVDHIEAHIAACRLAEPELAPPFIALVVSGGHTNLYRVRASDAPGGLAYDRISGTRDDAAGEAFDKAAKILGLGFPGGPAIDRAAAGGRDDAFPWRRTCLPSGGGFSFSGLKTAVLYAARGMEDSGRGPLRLDAAGVADAAASFQAAVVHALVSRTVEAAKREGVRWIALGGGVAANRSLREAMKTAAGGFGARLAVPPMQLCTDNAVMVAARGAELFRAGVRDGLDLEALARA